MMAELGREHPCFGDFECPRCYKKWQSSRAWADYGQECKSCSNKVKPTNLQKLFVYICKKCDTKWNWAYASNGQRCKNCSSSIRVYPLDRENSQDRQYIKAHKLRSVNDVNDENHIDSTREHRQDLCEKCQQLGRPCHKTNARSTFALTTDNRRTLPNYNATPFSYPHDEPRQQPNLNHRSTTSRTISTSPLRYSSSASSTASSSQRTVEDTSSSPSNASLPIWRIIFLLLFFSIIYLFLK